LVPIRVIRKLWTGRGGEGKSKGTVIKREVLKDVISKPNSSDSESERQEDSICVQHHNSSHKKVNTSEAQVGKHRQVQEESF
jgi:hypothetical protein